MFNFQGPIFNRRAASRHGPYLFDNWKLVLENSLDVGIWSLNVPPKGPVMDEATIASAARLLAAADALLLTAGAGMGVDSGLPDFRGTEGFWKAYPPYEKLGLRFESLANPEWFDSDP